MVVIKPKNSILDTTSSSYVIDKHKLWLGIGVALLAVLLVGVFIFTPAKQAFFGKAIFITQPNVVITPPPITTPPINTQPLGLNTCMPIKNLIVGTGVVVPAGGRTLTTNEKNYWTTRLREQVCINGDIAGTRTSCLLSGFEKPRGCTSANPVDCPYSSSVTYNLNDDNCLGVATSCPDVARFRVTGRVADGVRRTLCNAVSVNGQQCRFYNGADDSANGDLCVSGAACLNSQGKVDCTRGTYPMPGGSGVMPATYNDAACRIDSYCRNAPCVKADGTAGQWIWSHIPPQLNSYQLIDTSERSMTACCAPTQCATTAGECVNYDTTVSATSVSICGGENDWDKCGPAGITTNNKHAGDLSDGGKNYCDGTIWTACDTAHEGVVKGSLICRSGAWITPLPMEICTNGVDDNSNGKMDCADSDCSGDSACATSVSSGDINNDNAVDSGDVTFLLYVLRAQSDADCGGAGQSICDYSSDGIFACDSGTVHAMADENDRTHASDTCT